MKITLYNPILILAKALFSLAKKFNLKIRREMNEWMNECYFWTQWLEIGDVILLNKKYPGFGGFLLQHISPGPKATHIIIISKIDEKGNMFFSHATEHFFWKEEKSGIQIDVPLIPYLKKNPAKICILKPNKELREKAIKNLTLKENKQGEYDYSEALFSILAFPDIQKEKYNCGSYLAHLFGLKNQNLALPIFWRYQKWFTRYKIPYKETL